MQDQAATKTKCRYITRIRLENFQDHRDTDIRLESGINLITGSSDAGKSAILRALNWVLHNVPRGKSFIRHGSTEARVTVWWSDGMAVQRIKGDRNAIILRDAAGKEKIYDRIGTEIPPEVQTALGNPPIDEHHGPISYSEQMGPLFLVSLSSTELPRSLSALTHIEDYEGAAAALGRQARQSERQMKDSAERIARQNESLKKFAYLDEQTAVVSALRERLNNAALSSTRASSCRRLLSYSQDISDTFNQALESFNAASRVTQSAVALKDAKTHEETLTKGVELLSRHATLASEEATVTSRLATARRAINTELIAAQAKAIALHERITSGTELCERHGLIIENGCTIQLQYLEGNCSLQDARQKILDVISEMRSAGLWCQHCDRPITTEGEHEH